MHGRLASFAVLAVFAAGGVVAPGVHRAHHAAEAGAERRAHAAAGHHHHDAFGAHGLEWTPACDRPIVFDELACVLCKGLHAADLSTAPALVAPGPTLGAANTSTSARGADLSGAIRVRGPPHLIA